MNPNEQVHVKSYTKDDGTKVKEHWRGHGPSAIAGSGVMEGEWDEFKKDDGDIWNEKIPKDEQSKNPLKEFLDNISSGGSATMNAILFRKNDAMGKCSGYCI